MSTGKSPPWASRVASHREILRNHMNHSLESYPTQGAGELGFYTLTPVSHWWRPVSRYGGGGGGGNSLMPPRLTEALRLRAGSTQATAHPHMPVTVESSLE